MLRIMLLRTTEYALFGKVVLASACGAAITEPAAFSSMCASKSGGLDDGVINGIGLEGSELLELSLPSLLDL
jgi:hypothetical protein